MSRLLEPWERLTIEAKEIRAVGDTVLVRVAQHGKGKASGIEVDDSYFMLFTFRGRKIVRMEAVTDEAEALDAVGAKDNVEIARRAWEAAALMPRPDFETVNALYDPEHELISLIGSVEGGRSWRGTRGYREYLTEMGEAFESSEASELGIGALDLCGMGARRLQLG